MVMIRPWCLGRHRARLLFRPHVESFHPVRRRFSDRRLQDPLKILFCGADEFSIHSLRALQRLQTRRPESIASIDVVCRTGKRVGRGLKRVQEVPIKSVAETLSLPVHQIDTFTGWNPPSPVDLVVAVSFGLLVPSRTLKAALHGGLNVHPSLLPEFRGPAPIQHALLQARPFTGVTLQTMHPTRFDHGQILDQTPAPGVPIAADSTITDLVETLGRSGADMLSHGIENRLWLRQGDGASTVTSATAEEISHAPKIMPEDRHIDWSTWTADRIIRYDRVLGRLWDTVSYRHCLSPAVVPEKRVTFLGPWHHATSGSIGDDALRKLQPGDPTLVKSQGSSVLAFLTCDGRLLGPSAATIEGGQRDKGIDTLSRALTKSPRP